jgi:hypothetical protein
MVSVTRVSSVLYFIKPVTNISVLVTETLVTGLIKYNTDEGIVTETLVTGLMKYNNDEGLVHKAFISIAF